MKTDNATVLNIHVCAFVGMCVSIVFEVCLCLPATPEHLLGGAEIPIGVKM